jgi:hypothetical protein
MRSGSEWINKRYLNKQLVEVFTVVWQTPAMYGKTCLGYMLRGSNGCVLHPLKQSKHVSEMTCKLPHKTLKPW